MKVQDYIDANINEVITLNDLAKVAGYSQWHTERIFKDQIGISPFEYLRKLRLTKAALHLSGKHNKIIDVAFDFVFDSHEGFTRAFSKQFGVSPKQFSNNPQPIKLFMPQRAHDYCLKTKKGEKIMKENDQKNTVFVQVIDRDSRKLILKRGIKATDYYEYCEEVGCDVWDVLCNIKDALYEPAGMWLPKKLIKPNTSMYVQAVEVPLDYDKEIPEGFEIIELEPCKLMVFQGEPYDDKDFEQAITDLWDVIDKYDPTVYGFAWADDEAIRFQLEPKGYRGYIEARPVKQINN